MAVMAVRSTAQPAVVAGDQFAKRSSKLNVGSVPEDPGDAD